MRGVLIAVLVALASGAFEAAAAPVVTVRGRAAISLDPVHRGYDGAIVRGQVVDGLTRAPMGYVPVEIQLDYDRRTTYTDADGRFRVTFDVFAGTHDLFVTYPGDDRYTSAAFELRGFDVTKEPLELSLTAPTSAAWSQGTVEVVVRAFTPSGGTRVPLTMYGGDASAGATTELGRVVTDDTGRATFEVRLERLGGPGAKRLEARFEGDAAFNRTTATAELVLSASSTIDLRLDRTEVAYEDKLHASGSVTDDTGAAVAGAPVVMMVGTRRIAEVLADDAGAFDIRVAAAELGEGKHNVQAVFEPTDLFRKSARSEPAVVAVAEPQPVPVTYTVAAFAATLLAMVAFLGLRTRPWERFRIRREHEDAAERAIGAAEAAPEPAGGLVEARPSLVSTLRRAQDRGFAGTVRDAVSGRAVRGATVTILHTDEPARSGACDDGGRFAFEELASGRWEVAASAFGYCTERFPIQVPHRGELRGARIELLPVRERIFAMYRQAALPRLPDPALWGIWTPRQIFEHVRRGAAPAWRRLTDFVEETYFSQRIPEERVLERASALIDAAQHEAPGADAPATPPG